MQTKVVLAERERESSFMTRTCSHPNLLLVIVIILDRLLNLLGKFVFYSRRVRVCVRLVNEQKENETKQKRKKRKISKMKTPSREKQNKKPIN